MKIPQEAPPQPKFVWTPLATARPLAAALLLLAAPAPPSRAATTALTYDPSGNQTTQLPAASTAPTILSHRADRGFAPVCLLLTNDPATRGGSDPVQITHGSDHALR